MRTNIFHEFIELDHRLCSKSDVLDTTYSRAEHINNFFLIVSTLNPGAINEPDETGDTPLLKAVKLNKWGIAFSLLKFGADPYFKDMEGKTALDLAESTLINTWCADSFFNANDILSEFRIKSLILSHASINQSGPNIYTHLLELQSKRWEDQSSLLVYFIHHVLPTVNQEFASLLQYKYLQASSLKSDSNEFELHSMGKHVPELIEDMLSKYGDKRIAVFMLESLKRLGVLDFNSTDEKGNTILHRAFENQWEIENIKFLINSFDIDFTQKNNFNCTPIQWWLLSLLIKPEKGGPLNMGDENNVDLVYTKLQSWCDILGVSKDAIQEIYSNPLKYLTLSKLDSLTRCHGAPKRLDNSELCTRTAEVSNALNAFFNDDTVIQSLFNLIHRKHEMLRTTMMSLEMMRTTVACLKEHVMFINRILKFMHQNRVAAHTDKMPGPHVAVREEGMLIFDKFLDALSKTTPDAKQIHELIEELGNIIGNNTSFNDLPPEIRCGIFGVRYELMKMDKERLQNQSVASSKNELTDSGNQFKSKGF